MRARHRGRLTALFLMTSLASGCSDALGVGGTEGAPDPDASPLTDYAPGARIDVGTADAVFRDPRPGNIGKVVALPGDLDGDGFDDIVMANDDLTGVNNCGDHGSCLSLTSFAVYIAYGGPTMDGSSLGSRVATLEGWQVQSVFISLAGAGDVNGDGYDDLLVGLRAIGCTPGAAMLVYGGPRRSGRAPLRTAGAIFRDDLYCSEFGEVAGLGDVDGDGLDDFAIGAHSSEHEDDVARAHVFYGREERWDGAVSATDAASAVLRLPARLPWIPMMGAAGDVNGDGVGDYAFTIANEHAIPGGFLVLGGAARLEGSVDVESIATRLVGAALGPPVGLGDLDGDGMDELGLPGAEEDSPVFYGRASWPSELSAADAELTLITSPAIDGVSERPSCRFMARGGDVDGDGHADLLCGDVAYRNGVVAVLLGREGGRRGSVSLEAEAALILGRRVSAYDAHWGDTTGFVVAGGADVNGDGLADFVIGVPSVYSGASSTASAVSLFLGRSAS